MRKTLLSVSLIAATGSTLVAGGAFSLFNDTKTATGGYATGSVKLDIGSNTLPVASCTPSFVYADRPYTNLNMGSVNNNSCTSTITVTNKGTLPMTLLAVSKGSSVSDAITMVGSTSAPSTPGCFLSTITTDLSTIMLNPGGTAAVSVNTTALTDNGCQNVTDTVTVTLQVNESLPA